MACGTVAAHDLVHQSACRQHRAVVPSPLFDAGAYADRYVVSVNRALSNVTPTSFESLPVLCFVQAVELALLEIHQTCQDSTSCWLTHTAALSILRMSAVC